MRNSVSILNCLLTSIDCRSWHLRSKKRSKWVRTRFRNAVLEIRIIDLWSWSRLSLRQSLTIMSIFSLQSRRRSTTMKARLTDLDQPRITTSSILWKFFTTMKSFTWSMNVWKYCLEVFHLHRRESWSILRSQRCVKRYDFVLVHHLQVANFHQILDELFYVHTKLQLYYDELNCDNVWLKRDDVVKLINVDDVMLNDVKISEDIERKNVCTMFILNILRRSSTLSCLLRITRHRAVDAARLPRKSVAKNITSTVKMRSSRWGFTTWATRFKVCAEMISQSSWDLRDLMRKHYLIDRHLSHTQTQYRTRSVSLQMLIAQNYLISHYHTKILSRWFLVSSSTIINSH